MRLAWIETSPLTIVLVIGMLMVLIDLWQVRNDGLRGATSSRARNLFWAQLGIGLVSIGVSAFLSISSLTPKVGMAKKGS